MVRLLTIFWPILVLSTASCSGRTHSQREGTYGISLAPAIRDECSLTASLGSQWQGSFYFSGNRAFLQMNDLLFGMQLVGAYLENIEEFALDGTVANVTVTTGSGECLVERAAMHLHGETQAPNEFRGTVRLEYDAPDTPRCSCQLWAEYRALH